MTNFPVMPQQYVRHALAAPVEGLLADVVGMDERGHPLAVVRIRPLREA